MRNKNISSLSINIDKMPVSSEKNELKLNSRYSLILLNLAYQDKNTELIASMMIELTPNLFKAAFITSFTCQRWHSLTSCTRYVPGKTETFKILSSYRFVMVAHSENRQTGQRLDSPGSSSYSSVCKFISKSGFAAG